MLAGMVVAMRASMLAVSVGDGALWGGCIGLPVLAFTYAANAMLAGEAR